MSFGSKSERFEFLMKYVSAASLLQAFRQWSEYKKKKKRGADFVVAVVMLLFIGRDSLSELLEQAMPA